MLRRVCKLRFLTPVRFGADHSGSELGGVRMAARADTLYSALFLAMLQAKKEAAFQLAAEEGRLRFSDTLPRRGETLYIPRPMGLFGDPVKTEDPSARKKWKRIEYVPIGGLKDYLNGTASPEELTEPFGLPFEVTRVNTRDYEENMPYQVPGFRFFDGCGSYFIAEAADEAALGLAEEAIRLLQGNGFGGRASSGWGKFTYSLEEPEPALNAMLENENAPVQLLLSCAFPAREEAAVLEDACFSLCRRGGYSGELAGMPSKKQTVYLISAGSAFSRRFDGCILNAAGNTGHPVWRYAKAMFLGVSRE